MKTLTTETVDGKTLVKIVEMGLKNIESALDKNEFKQCTGTYYRKGGESQCEVCFLGAVGLNLDILKVRNNRAVGAVSDFAGVVMSYNNVLSHTGLPIEIIRNIYSYYGKKGDLQRTASLGSMIVYFNDSKEWTFGSIKKEIFKMVRAEVKRLRHESESHTITYMKETP